MSRGTRSTDATRMARVWQSVCSLRRDGRRSLTALSRETGIPISTLHERLRGWPAFTRSTVLLDFTWLSGVHAWLLVSGVPCAQLEPLQTFMVRHSAVNTVQRVTRDAQFLVEIIVPSLRTLDELVDAIHHGFGAGLVRILYVVDDVRREGYLTDPVQYPELTGTTSMMPVRRAAGHPAKPSDTICSRPYQVECDGPGSEWGGEQPPRGARKDRKTSAALPAALLEHLVGAQRSQ